MWLEDHPDFCFRLLHLGALPSLFNILYKNNNSPRLAFGPFVGYFNAYISLSGCGLGLQNVLNAFRIPRHLIEKIIPQFAFTQLLIGWHDWLRVIYVTWLPI